MNSSPIIFYRPRRCLVVDDEPKIADFLATVARDAGWLADTAASHAAIDACLTTEHPDLIVTDLAMPGYDGIEFIRWLADLPYRGKLMVISGCDRAVLGASVDLASLYGLDVVAFAEKPINAAQFESVLQDVA